LDYSQLCFGNTQTPKLFMLRIQRSVTEMAQEESSAIKWVKSPAEVSDVYMKATKSKLTVG